MAFAHLLRERIQGTDTQATGADRVERQLWYCRLVQETGRGRVVLQFIRDSFHRGCQKQRRGNRVENAVEAQEVRGAFHGGSPLFLCYSPRTWPVVTSCTAKTVGDPNQHARLSPARTKARARGPARDLYCLICSAKERAPLASRKRERSVQVPWFCSTR
ncbi:hypothetical protein D3C71_1542890 [compost metagenome]